MIGIGMIRLLYEAHDAAKSEGFNLDTQEGRDLFTARRAELAKPILTGLYAWIEQERLALSEDAPIRKAMNYCLNHKVQLHRFLEDGALRLECEAYL
ncbi:MAG: transposase [Deltaproteobacteria bacterium]|nr:transposase [Deltaproteobacteria bacterium]